MKQQQDLFNLIKRLKSISDIGLLYCKNKYDKERYAEMQEISYKMLQEITGEEMTLLKNVYADTREYPTAKVDIRGLIIKNNKILLVKEQVDNKWSLPGGWADIGYSPKEVIIKECKEETGLDVIPKKLLAVFDKKFHAHPPQPFYVYKMIFYCQALSTQINKGFDVMDVQYFDSNELPELSEDRILKSQIMLVFEKALNENPETYFE